MQIRAKKMTLALSFVLILATSTPISAAEDLVTLHLAGPHFPITLDPQRAEDGDSVDHLENLFLGLTDIDPVTAKIRPAMATAWQQDASGQVWTFTLRSDVSWVQWNAQTQQATVVRMVTAQDFVDAIQRSCDPRLNSMYAWVVANLIQGCDKVVALDKSKVTDSDLGQVAVKALSPTQLQITTRGTPPYFLQTTAYWIFRAIPKEIVQQYGDAWTQAGHIVTDGPFVLSQYVQDKEAVYMRNSLYPAKLTPNLVGNIQSLTYKSTGERIPLHAYINSRIDIVDVPLASAEAVMGNLDNMILDPTEVVNFVLRPTPAVFYFGFMYDKPPFDKVQVRRAVSAAIDRAAFAKKFGGQPIGHFTPPGMYGGYERGNPDADVGTDGFDRDYARAQLGAAGYPNCKGLPSITVEAVESEVAQYLGQMMQQSLGCQVGQVLVKQVKPDELIKDVKPGAKNRPQMFLLGWAPDYPDANNWVHDVLSCHSENDLQRVCTPIDDQIDQASAMPYGPDRIVLYHSIEQKLFATDGELPIAPLVVYTPLTLVKPWLKGPIQTDGQFGGYHWATYTIDQAAQAAGQKYQGCGCSQ